MGIKVKLRKKSITKNRESLYLDFYPPIINPETGEKTRREFLNEIVFIDKDEVQKRIKELKDKDASELNKLRELVKTLKKLSPSDKLHNTQTMQRAEGIRRKRENELNKPEIYTALEKEQLKQKEQGEINFVDYFKKIADTRKSSNHDNWLSAYSYLKSYTNGKLKIADLNEKFCNDFKDHLLTAQSKRRRSTKLSTNSASSYFNKLKAALKQAYKDNLISYDLNSKIECIENEEVIKQTLTIEELQRLINSECQYQGLKNIVLFAVGTGIPFKEMQNLIWGQIEVSEGFGIRVKMIRQKTGKRYFINISQDAYDLLGEPKEPNEKVFEGLTNADRYYFFPLWLAEVGIKKKMTFHDLRHTYGCLQIEAGTDTYTLQGNMGHSTPRQTMLYGKISDQRKREAANRIKLTN
jgi:integrase